MILRVGFIVFTFIIVLSCKNATITTIESTVKIEKSQDSILENTSELNSSLKVNKFEKTYTYKYVSAKLGLNFRDAPHGAVLGKFPYNLRLEILETTDKITTIKDQENVVKGKWVKVKFQDITGYVFDAYLMSDPVIIDYSGLVNNMSIIAMTAFEINDLKVEAFLSLTDGYWNNRFPNVINEEILNETSESKWELKGKERIKFLNNREIRETDSLYIYNYENNVVDKFVIENIPLIQYQSVYGDSFLTGFDLSDLINIYHNSYINSFASIGKQNPFEKGFITPIYWNSINVNSVPQIKLNYRQFYESDTYTTSLAFHFSQGIYDYYYTRNHFENNKYTKDYIFVITKSNKLLYKSEIFESESSSPSLFLNEDLDNVSQPVHFTGQLFKGKPPVIFGLFYSTFGCPTIDFIDLYEKSIYIQCDNRH